MKNWPQHIVIFSLLFAAGLILPRWFSTFHQEPIETTTQKLGNKKENSEKLTVTPELKEDTMINLLNPTARHVEKEKEVVTNLASSDEDFEPKDEKELQGFHRILLTSKREEISPNSITNEEISFHAIVFGNQDISDGDQITMLVEENVEIGTELLQRNEMIYPKVRILGDTLHLSIQFQENDFTGYNREEKMIILPVKQENKFKKIFKNNKVQSSQPTLKITDKFLVTFKKENTHD